MKLFYNTYMTQNNLNETEEKIDQYNMSFIEIATNLNITENEVKKIYNVAIRKLKHPKYYRYFKELINQEDICNENLEKYGENILKDN